MIPYWFAFLLPVVAALMPVKVTAELRNLLFLSLGIFYSVLIGFRFRVGGDWGSYIAMYDYMVNSSLSVALAYSDYGYVVLNRIMGSLDAQIYGVNLVCGFLFISGVIAFSRKQPCPWIGIAVAVPYLMIVVAMGYTRQSAALGLIFWGLAALQDGHVKRYATLIVIGALFHKTALIMLPFGFLVGGKKKKMVNILVLGGIGVLFALILLQSHYEDMWENYVGTGMESKGGMIRVLMNVSAGVAMFLVWKPWKRHFPDARLWFWIAGISILCVWLVGFASTAVDRIALYLAPLQVVVFSRIPVLVDGILLRTGVVVTILLGYTAVLWVWLNLGSHAHAWLPYQNILLP